MRNLYFEYEDRTRKHILDAIDAVSTDKLDGEDFTNSSATKLPKQFFVEILDIFYRRKK